VAWEIAQGSPLFCQLQDGSRPIWRSLDADISSEAPVSALPVEPLTLRQRP